MRSPAFMWAAVAFLAGVGAGLTASFLYRSPPEIELAGDASHADSGPGSTDATQPATDRDPAASQGSFGERPRAIRPPQEIYENHNRWMEAYLRAVENSDIERLLAAGYSRERIDWLRKRAAELQAAKRAEDTERRLRGLPPDPVLDFPFLFDQSIGLRDELGDDEYARYLEALGRPTSIGVLDVQRGSVADSVGIRPGDEIIRYGGKRMFNFGELLAQQHKALEAGGNQEVVVERDGQSLHFVVPGGGLGVRAPNQPIDVSDKILRASRETRQVGK